MKRAFVFSWEIVLYPLLFVLCIWMVYWFELKFHFNFNTYGVFPREWHGLIGVLTSPFIHGSLEHLFNNSVPLFLLGLALFYFYRDIAWKVLFFGVIISGLLTWVIARPAYHIGASGIVYVLSFFLFFKGIFSRNFRLTAVSLIIVFIYGSLVWGLFPQEKNISWEGHSAGAIAGLILSLVFYNYNPRPEVDLNPKVNYDEDDPFLQQFDENGNFISAENLPEEVKERSLSDDIEISYDYKEKRKE